MIALILSGCSSLDLARIEAAASRQGDAAAGIVLGELPDDCRAREPHAALVEGFEIRSILKRERAALDRANERLTRCADYHDDLVDHLEARP
ncbi:hypothetical protein [Neomesorhizobium albiziae]|uniref:hypothetical protein n=1 Tax=Neomesorhizobium albiziae TaxID=335020 RepID=UPI00313DDAD3